MWTPQTIIHQNYLSIQLTNFTLKLVLYPTMSISDGNVSIRWVLLLVLVLYRLVSEIKLV